MRILNFAGRLLRFLAEMVRRKPLPSPIINLYLMLRWRIYVHPFANIGFPYNLKIGRYSRIGKCKIVASPSLGGKPVKTIIIGERAMIGDGVALVSQGGYIEVGDSVSIHDYSIIYGLGGVTVGADSRIAAATIIVSHEHHFQTRHKKIRETACQGGGVAIGKDCWIGAGARILDGVDIGDGAIVGAGAVVTHDVLSETIVAGVPAKFLKHRYTEGDKE